MGEITNVSRKTRVPAQPGEGGTLPVRSQSLATSPGALWIGKQLRRYYGRALQEPVPQRFLDLLDELDKGQGK